jgi:hypothetical protein
MTVAARLQRRNRPKIRRTNRLRTPSLRLLKSRLPTRLSRSSPGSCRPTTTSQSSRNGIWRAALPVIAEIEQKSEVELPAKKQELAKPVEKKRQEPKRVQSQARVAKSETAQSTRTTAAAAAPSGDLRRRIGELKFRHFGTKQAVSAQRIKSRHRSPGLHYRPARKGHSRNIAGSTRSSALDAETLALVHPVAIPPPPVEMAGAQISLVVSLRYNIPRLPLVSQKIPQQEGIGALWMRPRVQSPAIQVVSKPRQHHACSCTLPP